jgi:transcriptional regulator with XRE-family HTH domain
VPPERPEDFVRRVAEQIAEVRRTRGMTQDQFAEALGTATRNIRRIEAGQNLTLYTLARIARVLAVQPRDLLPSGSANQRSGRYPETAVPTQPVAERPTGRARARKKTDSANEKPRSPSRG